MNSTIMIFKLIVFLAYIMNGSLYISSFPIKLMDQSKCNLVIQSGTVVMKKPIALSTKTTAIVVKQVDTGVTISDGSNYESGVIITLSFMNLPTGSQTLFEVTGGAEIIGTSGCSKSRTIASKPQVLLPSSSTQVVTIKGIYASGYGTVSIIKTFTLYPTVKETLSSQKPTIKVKSH